MDTDEMKRNTESQRRNMKLQRKLEKALIKEMRKS
jgi:hypothetical protein